VSADVVAQSQSARSSFRSRIRNYRSHSQLFPEFQQWIEIAEEYDWRVDVLLCLHNACRVPKRLKWRARE